MSNNTWLGRGEKELADAAACDAINGVFDGEHKLCTQIMNKFDDLNYKLARQRYAALGVNTDSVLKHLAKVPVSLHCWQGDDVGGFENFDGALSGGIVATGNYLGKARTAPGRAALVPFPNRLDWILTP